MIRMTQDMIDKLDALLARGPWSTTDGSVSGDDVRNLFTAIRYGRENPSVAAGIGSASGRRADRAFQLLKRAGLVRYVGRAWVAVEAAEPTSTG